MQMHKQRRWSCSSLVRIQCYPKRPRCKQWRERVCSDSPQALPILLKRQCNPKPYLARKQVGFTLAIWNWLNVIPYHWQTVMISIGLLRLSHNEWHALHNQAADIWRAQDFIYFMVTKVSRTAAATQVNLLHHELLSSLSSSTSSKPMHLMPSLSMGVPMPLPRTRA